MLKRIAIASSFLSVVVMAMWIFDIHIEITQDESLPYKLYLSYPLNEVKKEIFATFWHDETHRILGKKVVGLEGDLIEVRNAHIYLNGKDYGEIKEKSISGQTYQPIPPCVIPKGFCFVYGTHEFSFDSRYQEMGLIPVKELQRELWPLF